MRFVWYIMPQPEDEGEKGKEKFAGAAQSPDVEPGRKKLSEIGADLKGFIEGFEKADPKEKAEFAKKAAQWDQTENIAEIRRAGVEEAVNEKDPLKKHELLSALFLDRDQKAKGKMSFKVDFKGNDLAERKVGAGDLLPISAKAIRVQYADGRIIERAVRAINPANGRIGYYDENELQRGVYKYVPVFTGTTIDILETQAADDLAVKRRMFAENMEIYNPPKRAVPASTGYGGRMEVPRRAPLVPVISPYGINTPPQLKERTEINGQRYEAIDRHFWEQVGARLITVDPVTGGPLNFMGTPIPSINALIYPYLKEAEARMKAKGYKFDPDVIQCFNPRPIAGTNTPSYHTWGVAMDFDPGKNPQYQQWTNLNPETRVPKAFVDAMEAVGFQWGGRWTNKPDSMHFEFSRINPLTSTSLLTSDEGRKYRIAMLDPLKKPSETNKAYASNGSLESPEGISNSKTRNYEKIAEDHRSNFEKLSIRPQDQKRLKEFRERTLANRERYQRVANATGIPWMLIAAIHQRESGQRFDRYLGNGDPLDKVTTHVPAGRGPFPDWESGAIDALGMFTGLRDKLGIKADTTDPGKLMTFAEQYNGLGYRNRGYVSPYVYSGTNIYQGGLITTDRGPYNPNVWDRNFGVAEMLVALSGPEDYGPQKKNIAVA